MDTKTIALRNISELSWRRYEEHYCKIDPLVKSPLSPYPLEIYTTNDVLAQRHQEGYQYFQEFLLPQDFRWHMIVQSKGKQEFSAFLCLIRSREMQPFSAEDKLKAELIAPCFATCVEKVKALEKDDRKQQIIDAIIDKSGGGNLVVDESLSLIHANEAALQYLQLFEDFDDRLPLSLSQLFSRYYEELGKSSEGVVRSYMLKTRKDRKVRAIIRPLKCGGKRFYLLVSLDWDSHDGLCGQGLNALTKREVEIAMMVPKGLRSRDIAEKLFISTSTVDNHLRSIYEKLGISKRASLVRLIDENGFLGLPNA